MTLPGVSPIRSGHAAGNGATVPRGPEVGRGAAGRLHLSHGPIGVVLDISGTAPAVAAAEARAVAAFDGLLDTLVGELSGLRRPLDPARPLDGPVARRMAAAIAPYRTRFVTPMAAVAGAVADHLLAAIRAGGGITRAVVNNGGDIALWLTGAERYRIGISDYRDRGHLAGTVTIRAGDRIGGVATSGWQGRSHSLGIADAVTVLAETAAAADAAATMIANAVDLPGSPRIHRRAAHELAPDSDLGDRLVTVEVGALTEAEKDRALAAGVDCAGDVVAMGAARAVFLVLQGRVRTVATGSAARIDTAREET